MIETKHSGDLSLISDVRGRSPRRASAGLPVLLAVVLLSPAATFAQPQPTGQDYDYRNSEWNGLAELYRVLLEGGRQVQVDVPVDLAVHPISHPLVIVYPQRADLPAGELSELVRAGGRLLLADDIGHGGELMEVLGIVRHPDANPHGLFFRGNQALPILQPAGDHPIVDRVSRVLANHPVVLSAADRREAVVPFDHPDFGLLYAMELGEGRAVVIGDPSIFINFMLSLADNRTLALNAIRWLCEGVEPCSLAIATRTTPVFGDFPAEEEEALGGSRDLDALFRESFERVNRMLGVLTQFRPNPRGVFFAAVFLGLGVAVFLLSALPLMRPKWLSFSFRPADRLRSRSEFEWNLERLLDEGREGDYALPLAILKDEFEDLFMGALARNRGELDAERRYEPEQQERFADRFAAKAGSGKSRAEQRAVRARALAVLQALRDLPGRNNLVPEVDARYSERLFKRIHGEVRWLLNELGIWEQYERRTRRP